MSATTVRQIQYSAAPVGHVATIPAGTRCTIASNLPPRHDGKHRFWARPWKGMKPLETSWQDNYGFLIEPEDVETNSPRLSLR